MDGTSDILVRSGISAIFPDADIHGWQFEPCGYSCNGMMDNSYFTIHVTPEAESSYVSFGTNVKRTEYGSVVEKVLRIFKPQVCAWAVLGVAVSFLGTCSCTWVVECRLRASKCLRESCAGQGMCGMDGRGAEGFCELSFLRSYPPPSHPPFAPLSGLP